MEKGAGMNIIEARDLKKSYKNAVKEPGLGGAFKHLFRPIFREVSAVDGISLNIPEGQTVAYVGPNGAGKSTTIKMLTGILKPTSGEIRVNGLDPYKNRMKNAKNIGVVFGQRTQLWWDIPVIESFTLIRDIYDVPEGRYQDNLKYLTEMLGLKELLSQSARKLSLGQRMRCDLAVSLLHNPAIIYLDEPTIGLDVAVREKIREFLKKVNEERGVTIMLTSHDLDDIKDVCERIVVIDHGRLIYDGGIREMVDEYVKERTIHLHLKLESPKLLAELEKLERLTIIRNEGCELSLRFDRFKYSASQLLKHMMTHAEISDFQIEEPDIEAVVKNVYNGNLELHEVDGNGR